MPQMAPLAWAPLAIFFLLITLCLLMSSHWAPSFTPPAIPAPSTSKPVLWKW